MMNDEFSLLLKHLTGASNNEALKAHYLNYAAFSRAGQTGFSGRIAAFAFQGPWRLKIADVWTRLFDKNNILRHKLNLVVALAECGPGFSNPDGGESTPRSAWIDIFKILIQYVTILGASAVCIGGLYVSFKLRKS